MMKQKIIDALIYVATGYTVAGGILGVLLFVNGALFGSIIFHYSDSLTWYVFFFLFPLAIGFTFYLWLRNKQISKPIKNLLSTISILKSVFIVIVPIMNYCYWGYAFKRPAVLMKSSLRKEY